MLVNERDGKVISKRIRVCKGIVCKAIGLMFRFHVEEPLVFSFGSMRRIALHMFFVFTPIDVIWLDAGKKVVEMKEGFRPFCYYSPAQKAQYVIELPPGIISQKKIALGDHMRF